MNLIFDEVLWMKSLIGSWDGIEEWFATKSLGWMKICRHPSDRMDGIFWFDRLAGVRIRGRLRNDGQARGRWWGLTLPPALSFPHFHSLSLSPLSSLSPPSTLTLTLFPPSSLTCWRLIHAPYLEVELGWSSNSRYLHSSSRHLLPSDRYLICSGRHPHLSS